MAAPLLTPAALAEVRRLVAREKYEKPVVHVWWEPRQGDNERGANGENVWTHIHDGCWSVFVLDYDDPDNKVVDAATIDVDGLEFLNIFRDRNARPIAQPKLDFNGAEFELTDAAI